MTELRNPGESPVVFHSGGRRLFGILYEPRAPSAETAFVLCNPLFEERKASHGVLVRLARALAGDGHAVLRFDYSGCGNSEGAFRDFSIPEWIDDIITAAGYLRNTTGRDPVGLIGLRLGASLSVMAAAAAQADALVLWEPVTDGRTYLDAELRKKLMKEMVTFGRSRTTRDDLLRELADGRSVDFDGYDLTPALYRDMEALSLTTAPPLACRTLYVQVSAQKAMSPTALKLVEHFAEKGSPVTSRLEKAKPFWNLIGLTECSELISTTRQWIAATTDEPETASQGER